MSHYDSRICCRSLDCLHCHLTDSHARLVQASGGNFDALLARGCEVELEHQTYFSKAVNRYFP